MKKLLVILSALGLCASAFGQADVSFGNSSSTLITTNFTGGAAAPSSGYEVELFYQPFSGGPAPAPIISNYAGNVLNQGNWEMPLAFSSVVAMSPIRGRFNGGVETLGSDVAAGGMAYFESVGWNGGYSSLSLALASNDPNEVMVSSLIWSQTTGGEGTPPTLPASITGSGEFSGLAIAYAPEPSVVALGGLGGMVLLWLRRRPRTVKTARDQIP